MRGFSVGHSVQACTKGIWLWNEPLFIDENTLLLVLDCEGLYSAGNLYDISVILNKKK